MEEPLGQHDYPYAFLNEALAERPEPSELCRLLANIFGCAGVVLLRPWPETGRTDCAHSPGIAPLVEQICLQEFPKSVFQALRNSRSPDQNWRFFHSLSELKEPGTQSIFENVLPQFSISDASILYLVSGQAGFAVMFLHARPKLTGNRDSILPGAALHIALSRWLEQWRSVCLRELGESGLELGKLGIGLASLGRNGRIAQHNEVFAKYCLRFNVSDEEVARVLGGYAEPGLATGGGLPNRLGVSGAHQILLIPRPKPLHLDHIASPVRRIGVLLEAPYEDDPVTRLGISFGLTKSELRIVRALCEGLSVSDTAERHRIAASTVRQQLKSVYRKTDCNTQSQIVAKILNSPYR